MCGGAFLVLRLFYGDELVGALVLVTTFILLGGGTKVEMLETHNDFEFIS